MAFTLLCCDVYATLIVKIVLETSSKTFFFCNFLNLFCLIIALHLVIISFFCYWKPCRHFTNKKKCLKPHNEIPHGKKKYSKVVKKSFFFFCLNMHLFYYDVVRVQMWKIPTLEEEFVFNFWKFIQNNLFSKARKKRWRWVAFVATWHCFLAPLHRTTRHLTRELRNFAIMQGICWFRMWFSHRLLSTHAHFWLAIASHILSLSTAKEVPRFAAVASTCPSFWL